MTGNGSKRSIPEMSVDTRVLIERLKKVEVGEFVSYQELSDLVGRNVQGNAYGNLSTARHRLEMDEEMQFGTVRSQGLRRLDALGVMGGTDGAIHQCHKKMSKEARRLARIDPSGLEPDKKPELHLKAAHVQVLAYQTAPKVQRKLESKLKDSESLPMSKMLEAVKETL